MPRLHPLLQSTFQYTGRGCDEAAKRSWTEATLGPWKGEAKTFGVQYLKEIFDRQVLGNGQISLRLAIVVVFTLGRWREKGADLTCIIYNKRSNLYRLAVTLMGLSLKNYLESINYTPTRFPIILAYGLLIDVVEESLA